MADVDYYSFIAMDSHDQLVDSGSRRIWFWASDMSYTFMLAITAGFVHI
jgi:hypothetical protein